MIKIGNVRGFKKEDVRALFVGEVLSGCLKEDGSFVVELKLEEKTKQVFTLTFPRVYVIEQLPSTIKSRLLRGKITADIPYVLYCICLPNGNTAYHFKDYELKYHSDLKEVGWLTKPEITAIGKGRDISRSFTNGPRYKIVLQNQFPFIAKQ